MRFGLIRNQLECVSYTKSGDDIYGFACVVKDRLPWRLMWCSRCSQGAGLRIISVEILHLRAAASYVLDLWDKAFP